MTSLNGAISRDGVGCGRARQPQSALTATQTDLSDTQTALTTQLSGVQDVDMASDHVEHIAGTDAASGVVSDDRHGQRLVAGEIPAGGLS